MAAHQTYKKETFYCYRDELRIYGVQYVPKGENLPILIISHGFMADCTSVKKYAETFAKKGYACFIFDFNGGGIRSKSEGKTTDMTVYTEVKDLKTVISHAKSLPFTDASRVILMGCSQGGVVSAMTAAELGPAIAKLVLFYPALCIPDDARKGQMISAKFDPQNIPDVLSCGPMKLGRDYPACVMEKDIYEMIGGYTGPVLIVHGTKDAIVDISYSVKAHQIYADSSLVTVHGGGHGFLGKHDRLAVYALWQFLNGRREVLCVDVALAKPAYRRENGVFYLSLPFTGNADGDYFSGTICPGASDEQEYQGFRQRHMCATYDIKGRDFTGEECHVHVVNISNGKGWRPTVSTDSNALAKWNGAGAAAFLEQRKSGPIVHIFMRKP